MNILFLHDEPWDSGIWSYAFTLALEMKSRGHAVHFWCKEKSFAEAQCRRFGLSVLPLKKPWLQLAQLRQKVRADQISIINAFTGSSQTLGLAVRGKAALVRTCADARLPGRNFLSRLGLGMVSHFIAANTMIQKSLEKAAPDSSTIDLVFQGIPGCPKDFSLELPSSGAVGILGRLDKVKGHETFIQAASLVRSLHSRVKFLIAGESNPERLHFLQSKVRQLELGDSIEFLGRVDNIWEFVSRCRIGVVASLGSEAVSRAALEWMSAGRPVVSSRVGGMPDLVCHGENGFIFSPGNAEELASALKKLIDSHQEVEKMGQKSKNRFENLFNLRKFGESSEQAFKKISGENS